jgi:serine/threonine protein kinase
MGSVYAATDPELARRVAIKVLHASASDDAAAGVTARMRREAQAMARLSHPNVVTVFDVGTHEGCVFVAMEFVEGTTLREWHRASRRSWDEVLHVFVQAGRGLSAAHAAGLVHRDFKPDNVLVGHDGRVLVTDFGLVRTLDDVDGPPANTPHAEELLEATLTRTGTLIGTPAYMAPEALTGGGGDARSDIFSFCVALYEGLYGARPFGGNTLLDLRASIEGGVARAPGATRGVPPSIRKVLAAGLRSRPELRPSSMGELLDGLKVPPTRRITLWAMLAAGVALLAAAALLRPSLHAAPVPDTPPPAAVAASATALDVRGAPAQAVPSELASAELQGLPGPSAAAPTLAAATIVNPATPRRQRAAASSLPSVAAAPMPSSTASTAPSASLRFGANHAPILR